MAPRRTPEMVCREVLDRLSPFLDGELDPFASREVSRHLESCPSCSAELARQKQLGEAMRRELEYHAAPHRLRARVVRDVHAAVRHDDRQRSRVTIHPWRWVSAAAAMV